LLIDAAMVYMGHQLTTILRFFLSKNIRIARDRVWQHTVASRGKGLEWFQPYVEEWDQPPRIGKDELKGGFIERIAGGWIGTLVLKRGSSFEIIPSNVIPNAYAPPSARVVILAPLSLYPLVGTVASASIRALGMSRILHRRVRALHTAYPRRD
jgi:hypothetical protein